jgi:DnaJ-class molecular chaperone
VIPGEGMLRKNGKILFSKNFSGERGNLILKFLIDFPKKLTNEQKEELSKIF